MTGTLVADIKHYLDDDGELAAELPSPARKLASFLVLVVDAVTKDVPAADHDTRIRCFEEGCTGSISASLASIEDDITWSCPTCGHNGVIRNWNDTKWNQQRNEVA